MRWIRLLGLFALLLTLVLPAGRGAWAAPAERRWLAEPMLLSRGETAAWVDLDAVDANHVWAIAGSNILFFDGTSWSVQFSADVTMRDIEMAGPARGWAIGAVNPVGERIYAFDGTGWRQAPSPNTHPSQIFAAGDGSLLLIGWNGISGSNGRQTLEYFDGAAWHDITPYDRGVYHVQVARDGSTWVWGNAFPGISTYDAPQPFILRFGGGTLTSINVPVAGPSGPGIVSRDGLTSAVMAGADEGWAAVTSVEGQIKIYRYAGGAWSETSVPPQPRPAPPFRKTTFIAGNPAEILAVLTWNSSDGCDGPNALLRYAGGAWSVVASLPANGFGALLPDGTGWISTHRCADAPAQRFRYAAGQLAADSAGADVVPTRYDLAGADAQWAAGPGMIMRYTDAASPTAPAAAQAGARFFPETGHNLSGPFRAFYERNGLDFGEPGISAGESLALFGYPLTEPFNELNPDTGEYLLVQYFERVRMEYHPNNPDPYKVLLGRLGAVRYIQANYWIRSGDPDAPLAAGCERIAPTNHDLCPPFRDYWHSVGSVQIFGLPIAGAASETSYTDGATYLTLWTERERLEHHPELAGTRYEILLGLLAKEDLRMRGHLE